MAKGTADETPTPRRRYQDRQSAVQSDLDYMRQRQSELANRTARDARYRPGYRAVAPDSRDNEDRLHRFHERKNECTCGNKTFTLCPVCQTPVCLNCRSNAVVE